ncbi:MAG: PEP-CTERM sorting domain-containing protein [Pseudomonadales bacterium]|nr:PEP-CTERM sorting domain-containing protein [Pseudomonadales bacterium]
MKKLLLIVALLPMAANAALIQIQYGGMIHSQGNVGASERGVWTENHSSENRGDWIRGRMNLRLDGDGYRVTEDGIFGNFIDQRQGPGFDAVAWDSGRITGILNTAYNRRGQRPDLFRFELLLTDIHIGRLLRDLSDDGVAMLRGPDLGYGVRGRLTERDDYWYGRYTAFALKYIRITKVPEPGTLGLLVLGLVGLSLARKGRKG